MRWKSLSVLALFLTGLFLLAPAVLLTVGPAVAHDSLIDSDPGEGEVVEEVPDSAVLTFSGQLIDIAPQTILSRDGEQIETAPAVIDGYELITELPELTGGDYRLAYSVVSSDGHRIEGAVDFTVAGEAPSASTDTTTEGGGDQAGSETGSETGETPSDEPDNATSVTIIRWTGIIVVILGVSVIITRFIRKRR